MSGGHAEPLELALFLDGELTENRASALRAHLAVCLDCRVELDRTRSLVGLLGEPVEGVPSHEALPRLLRRVDEAGGIWATAAEPGRTRRRAWILAVGLAAAASVVVIVVPAARAPHGAFVARGGAVPWSDQVWADLFLLGDPSRRPAPGSAVGPGAAYVVAFRNSGNNPAYLLAFALDAAGELHWLYPAFTAAGTDPASIRLEPGGGDAALPESGTLDRPATGRLRWFLMITRAPLRVSTIEGLPRTDVTIDLLRARWPDAVITSVDLRLDPAGASR